MCWDGYAAMARCSQRQSTAVPTGSARIRCGRGTAERISGSRIGEITGPGAAEDHSSDTRKVLLLENTDTTVRGSAIRHDTVVQAAAFDRLSAFSPAWRGGRIPTVDTFQEDPCAIG
ncbi:hypothetical protein NWFMUON74_38570 [Nocardia wallacei]|uniref:Uncharacterized protein n=1 Tax=Nocardia wallacei TaxID=480035 RepID=A0A7G1KLH1_9NOCA|nr:hypothetical protein NWFMUON74_38570 [Nocardia wallacei]